MPVVPQTPPEVATRFPPEPLSAMVDSPHLGRRATSKATSLNEVVGPMPTYSLLPSGETATELAAPAVT